MVELVLYSDQVIAENGRIDRRLLAILEARGKGSRIGYIPSGPDPSGRFFSDRIAYYARLGLDLCILHDLDQTQDQTALSALLACDAIHLSGGHTDGFLAWLRRAGMLDVLRRYAFAGGILIGASAGAILMTPAIATDALFSGGRPEDVRGGDALDLVPFEFFPHLQAKPDYLPELVRYSLLTPRLILAVNDGDGVVVSGGQAECLGNVLMIAAGEIQPVTALDLSQLAI